MKAKVRVSMIREDYWCFDEGNYRWCSYIDIGCYGFGCDRLHTDSKGMGRYFQIRRLYGIFE